MNPSPSYLYKYNFNSNLKNHAQPNKALNMEKKYKLKNKHPAKTSLRIINKLVIPTCPPNQ